MTEHSPVQIPVTRIAFTSNVSETSQFSFETYVPQDAPIEIFHAVVDKLVQTADRQQAKGKLATLKFELEGVRKQIGPLDRRSRRPAGGARRGHHGRQRPARQGGQAGGVHRAAR